MTEYQSVILAVVVAVLVTAACIILLRPAAHHLGLVDEPGGRKLHNGAVPLIGGIAMFCGFSFALLTLNLPLHDYRSFLAAGLLLVCAGVLDDFHELTANYKLLIQIIAASFITLWGHVLLTNLGNLFFIHDFIPGIFAVPLTMIAVIGVVNAVNMTDGLDGLAGGLAVIQLGFFYWLALRAHQDYDQAILLILIAAAVTFLLFNFPFPYNRRAKVFMGDTGSMFLGLVLVWYAVKLSQGATPAVTPVTMLWILGVPLLDTFTAIIRRLRKGRSPFTADKAHFHDVFLQAGYSSLQTTLLIYAISIGLGFIGILGNIYRVPEGYMFMSFVGLFIAYLYAVNHAWRVMKILKRRSAKKQLIQYSRRDKSTGM